VKLNEVLSNPKATPVGIASALMELDVAARGGTATGASMGMMQSHLGGLLDQIRGAIVPAARTPDCRPEREMGRLGL
jgi:hypothetical protein